MNHKEGKLANCTFQRIYNMNNININKCTYIQIVPCMSHVLYKIDHNYYTIRMEQAT